MTVLQRLLMLALLIFLVAAESYSQNTCIERIRSEAALINPTQIASGTGFLINNNGFIVTNKHVIHNSDSIFVTFFNGNKKITKKAEIVISSIDDDIALLKAPIEGFFNDFLPYGFNKNEMNLGEKIFTLGFPSPDLLGDNIKLTDGIINSLAGFMNDKSLYQISSPIQPGSSGSPMFDAYGNVRGVVVSSYVLGQNVNYAIKSEVLFELIEATNYGLSLDLRPAIAKKSFNEFNSLIPQISRRICLIYTSSAKTFYQELSLNTKEELNKINTLGFNRCIGETMKSFVDLGKIKRDNKIGDIDSWVDQKFSSPLEKALFYSYVTNYHWSIGLVARKFSALLEINAYENVIQDHDNKFDFSSNSVETGAYLSYIDNVLDYYLTAKVLKSSGYSEQGYWETYLFIERLLKLNMSLKYSAVSKKSYEAYLLTKKAAFMILLERHFSKEEICKTISRARQLDRNVDIAFLEYECN